MFEAGVVYPDKQIGQLVAAVEDGESRIVETAAAECSVAVVVLGMGMDIVGAGLVV